MDRFNLETFLAACPVFMNGRRLMVHTPLAQFQTFYSLTWYACCTCAAEPRSGPRPATLSPLEAAGSDALTALCATWTVIWFATEKRNSRCKPVNSTPSHWLYCPTFQQAYWCILLMDAMGSKQTRIWYRGDYKRINYQT